MMHSLIAYQLIYELKLSRFEKNRDDKQKWPSNTSGKEWTSNELRRLLQAAGKIDITDHMEQTELIFMVKVGVVALKVFIEY